MNATETRVIDVGRLHCDLLSCIAVAPVDQATRDRISNEVTALVEAVRARLALDTEILALARNPKFGHPRFRAAKARECAAFGRFREPASRMGTP